MTVIAGRLATTFPDSNTGWGARVISAQEQLVTTVRPALLLISAAVGFLLLIVCANVANLMLARLSSRRGEIAVRAALGAGRMQLVRQVLTESFVLSGIGGGLGLLVAWAGVRLVRALPEGSLPRMQEVRLDGGVLLFALLISIGVALFRLVPALQASRRIRDTMNAFGDDPPFADVWARSWSSRSRWSLMLCRRRLMTQLRSADAGRPGFEPDNRWRCRSICRSRVGRTGLDRTCFYMDAICASARSWGPRRGRRQCVADVSGRYRLCAAVHDGHAAPVNGESRGRHPHATPDISRRWCTALRKGRFIDGRDRQGAPVPWSSTRPWRGVTSPARIRWQDRAQPYGKGEAIGAMATSSTTGRTSRGPNCSCRPAAAAERHG